MGEINLEALRNHPQLQQLRQLIQTNPDLIGPLIQQLMASNPQLGQLFESNPEALMQLLGGDGDGEGDDGAPPGAHIIHITPEEQAAIGRVSSLTRLVDESCSFLTTSVGSFRFLAPESC